MNVVFAKVNSRIIFSESSELKGFGYLKRLLKLRSVASLLPEVIANSISIVGIGALSALGKDVEMHFRAILAGETGIRRLSALIGNDSPMALKPAAWISSRALLTHRKWSPASMAALHVAKEAVLAAGWTADELSEAALVVGTSRGNAAGWLGDWPGRRPFKLMAASNTIHSEPATAVSIECGIFGPNHVVSSGCSAGLDALGLAKLLLDSGQAARALVVAVDLPLVPILLDNYAASGLLGSTERLNPFSIDTDGFVPGEGAAALALSTEEKGVVNVSFFANNSDGKDPVGVPKDGGRSSELIAKAVDKVGPPSAICPHATGTKVQARAERTIFEKSFNKGEVDISLHLLKPYFGHTIGASGLLEGAVLARFMRESRLPPNIKGTAGLGEWSVPDTSIACTGPVFKLAHGMGGHNALTVFQINS